MTDTDRELFERPKFHGLARYSPIHALLSLLVWLAYGDE